MAQRTALSATLIALALSLLFLVAGCDEDSVYQAEAAPDALEAGAFASFSGAEINPDSTSLDPDALYTISVGGSVGDGPIVNARLRVFSNSGRLLHTSSSDNTADYRLRIRTRGGNYPLTIVADRGMDIVTGRQPDFDLVTTVMSPGSGQQTANLNPYSTLIVNAAQKSGGISNETIAAATEAVRLRYGFGLDSSLVADPTFSPMNNSNVHVIVKASETLGEMVRRTRDALITSGTYLDGDAVMEALAADLTDGWIDGKGAKGHDPRIAAVANVASAAVMVEAMANRLHVYNVDATNAMDNAIRQVRPDAPASSNTRNVPISADALAQSKRALHAAALMTSDDRVRQVLDAVAATNPGATEIQALPAGIENVLNDAVLTAAYIFDQGELEELNKVARAGSDSESSDQGDWQPKDDANIDIGNVDNVATAPNEETTSASDPVANHDSSHEGDTASEPAPVRGSNQHGNTDDAPDLASRDEGQHINDGASESPQVFRMITNGDFFEGSLWNDPHVLHDGTRFIMYASASKRFGEGVRIYRLVSDDGIAWELNPPEAVLKEGGEGAWDAQSVETPSVVHYAGKYHMFYTGYATSHSDIFNYKIGHAWSSDGVNWTKTGFVVEPTDPYGEINFDFNQYVTGEPGAVVLDGKIYLYFAATGVKMGVGVLQVIGLVTAVEVDGELVWSEPEKVLEPDQDLYPRATYVGYSTPAPTMYEGNIHLYVDVAEDEPWRQAALHRVTSADGRTSWQHDEHALFRSEDFEWTQGEIRAPSVLYHQGRRYLYFAGHTGTIPYVDIYLSIGVAISDVD